MRTAIVTVLVAGVGFLSAVAAVPALDFSNARVPEEEIVSGGPPKDGIPALTDPRTLPAAQSGFLKADDRVLGLMLGGQARAYPIRILNWHELVNDTLGGRPVLVSYCPLCASGLVFDARVGGERLTFGVSGRLYNSDVLFYDRKTESLWSQLAMTAVTGEMAGTRLKPIPSETTTWQRWRRVHPETTVLSPRTGHARDYGRDPYAGYETTGRLMFPVDPLDRRLPAKARVIGIALGGEAKAYPLEVLAEVAGPGGKGSLRLLQDRIGGTPVTVEYDPAARSARILGPDGRMLPAVTAYWFAWAAFHPETELFAPEGR